MEVARFWRYRETVCTAEKVCSVGAAKLASEIGGKKSLGRLGMVSRNDSNGIVKLVADQALKAVRMRNP